MDIYVTQEHIAAGEKGEPRLCPIHFALRPFMTCWFEVSDQILATPYKRSFLLPKAVRDFINWFDHYKPVSPFSFSMSAENFIYAK